MEKIKLVSIVGPTASGKTGLSIEVAKKYGGEVVSADSMQIYKFMNIATAKPSVNEMDGIPHHLMDFISPSEEYSVAQFVTDAKNAIVDINSRKKLPVLVGGTGLYVNSLLNNVRFTDAPIDEKLRENLNKTGTDELLKILSEIDYESYEKLSVEKNHKRIARAVEIYYQTGKPKSQLDREAMSFESPYEPVKIGLTSSDRNYLYERINRRVDLMVEKGLLDEAKEILQLKLSSTASKAIGYKEFIPYLNNQVSLSECTEVLKRETRRYAKRQLTWFKRDKEINWFNINELSHDEICRNVFELIDSSL